MTIREFLETLRHRWKIIMATMWIVIAATAWATLQTPSVYESSTRVYLLATSAGSQGNLFNMPGSEKETLIQVAASPIVLDAVREQLGLGPGIPVSVTANTVGDTNLLDVRARSNDPQRAADIATAVPQQLASIARNYAPSLSQSGQSVEAQVVAPAGRPSSPVTPNVPRNLALGALAGIVLGMAFALARQALDLRLREPRDLEALSDRPVLSSVPERKTNDPHSIYLDLDPFGTQAEAVRRLRTNLMFVDVTTGKHSFVISSTLPGEGKTTTAANLGLAMADSGTRTLLVDADLRNPSVARTMGLEGSVGLTTILLGDAQPADVIQQWGDTELYVLPAGQIPPNPSELLGSEPMKDLMSTLSRDYDFVLIDSPPILPVIDAVVVERLSGGLLMVVGVDRTRKSDLASALKQLSTVGATVSGFARNFVASQSGDHRYGYYRYQAPPTTRRDRRKKAAGRS